MDNYNKFNELRKNAKIAGEMREQNINQVPPNNYGGQNMNQMPPNNNYAGQQINRPIYAPPQKRNSSLTVVETVLIVIGIIIIFFGFWGFLGFIIGSGKSGSEIALIAGMTSVFSGIFYLALAKIIELLREIRDKIK